MEAPWLMSIASTGKPPPFSFTRSDLERARRMVRRLGVYDEADDVVQEVAIAMLRYSSPFAIPPGHTRDEALRIVMSGFVRRQTAHHRAERARRWAREGEPVRGRERDGEDYILERMHGAAPSVEDTILERARVTLLRAAVEELRNKAPEMYAVMRGELDGMPIVMIAAQLGIPLGTAYDRSRRGREAVREQFTRWEDEEARGRVRACFDAVKRARDGRAGPAT